MEIIFINNSLLTYRGQSYQIGIMSIIGDAVMVQLIDSESDFNITLVSNETTINDIVQTSADMIIETLSNGQS
jgi:hypothetical protein